MHVKPRRLRRMPIEELLWRARQETAKLIERAGAGRKRGARRRQSLDLARFRAVAPTRFFRAALSPQDPQRLAARMPDACAEVVSHADAVCRGELDLLGFPTLSFGDPIDWHLDAVSGRRSPFVHWSRLNPLDSAAVGDSKVVWELNRHQWMVRLGQAYRLTGNEKYAKVFATHVWDWLGANPPGLGINWASSLEVAFRLISWCWSLCLFSESAALSPGLFARLVEGIWDHAMHVERNLSYYFSPNTHLTGEALGLYYTGLIFPELPRSNRWREVGLRILLEESERQILPDGTYFERATGYQRYTLEIYFHFLILSAQNGAAIPHGVSERVGRMLDCLLAIRFPDGSIPQIGDGDSGSLLPLARRAQHDFSGIFAVGAALLGRADCAQAAGSAAPEVLWLLGSEGFAAFDALRAAPPASVRSGLLADGGYAIMRCGAESDAHQLTFDVGPLGCPVSGGHGHADLLSIQCAAFGEPYLVDAGTYSYTGDSISREFFRGTAAHSTVTVDGQPQALSAGPFQWRERPRARLRDWVSTPQFDFADADHGGYCRLPGAVVHRRRIVFVKAGYWILVDDVDGSGEHHVEVRFQFAPVDVQVDNTPWARARGRTGRGLLIRPFSTACLTASVHTGELAPMQGWVSIEYGRREPAPLLKYAARTTLPIRILTLWIPSLDVGAAAPAVSFLIGDDAAPAGVAFSDGRSVRFDQAGVRVTDEAARN